MPSAAPASVDATTYTTIPFSGADVISRSFQNLSTFLSRRRPWSELIATIGSFDRPDSLSAAGIRLRLNAKYFAVNYAIIVSICAAASLMGAPISLIVFASVFVLWLVLHFFREDPVLVWGHHVSDRVVIVGLLLFSAAALWFTESVTNLLIGIAVGLLISSLHGVLRNPEGLFLDEGDAVYNGLIASRSGSNSTTSYRADLSN